MGMCAVTVCLFYRLDADAGVRRKRLLKFYGPLLLGCFIFSSAPLSSRAESWGAPQTNETGRGAKPTFSDPVTLLQVRALFESLDLSNASLPRLHQALEEERKKLPPWYPAAIWDDIEHAIENTDRAELALPVYRKYLSRGEAQLLLKFYNSAAGKALTRKLLASAAVSRAAGSSSEQARVQAAQSIPEVELKKANQAWSRISSEERRQAEFFVDSGDYKHFVQSVAGMSAEYAELFRARQQQIIESISEAHGGDLTAARETYKVAHPPLPVAPAPQSANESPSLVPAQPQPAPAEPALQVHSR